jgi:hypothetical protein
VLLPHLKPEISALVVALDELPITAKLAEEVGAVMVANLGLNQTIIPGGL